jgi:hypothetical protein
MGKVLAISFCCLIARTHRNIPCRSTFIYRITICHLCAFTESVRSEEFSLNTVELTERMNVFWDKGCFLSSCVHRRELRGVAFSDKRCCTPSQLTRSNCLNYQDYLARTKLPLLLIFKTPRFSSPGPFYDPAWRKRD